eukprot:CAMPEP_0182461722 /NCGR_PEP_ID=MMETSP1319-20130603/6210_1 /TAXON_ID=172717 /ORGANISM="Bolidomonas pacifica, Strain RCC208" /LENGTH=79 /DNA_ID=CAMNT_0024661043 /DNA_START=606 /DNA_END=845 /DNA_ORIENTATION=-
MKNFPVRLVASFSLENRIQGQNANLRMQIDIIKSALRKLLLSVSSMRKLLLLKAIVNEPMWDKGVKAQANQANFSEPSE